MSRSNFGFNVDHSDATWNQPSAHASVPTKKACAFSSASIGFLFADRHHTLVRSHQQSILDQSWRGPGQFTGPIDMGQLELLPRFHDIHISLLARQEHVPSVGPGGCSKVGFGAL